jgi:branched-subunit amino acid transport protein
MSLWITFLAIGMGTYVMRLSFILLVGQYNLPELVRRGLRFVPPAVLTAIIFPELLLPSGTLSISPGNFRLVAGLLAVVVAWRSQNAPLTIACGMAALWLLQAFA